MGDIENINNEKISSDFYEEGVLSQKKYKVSSNNISPNTGYLTRQMFEGTASEIYEI